MVTVRLGAQDWAKAGVAKGATSRARRVVSMRSSDLLGGSMAFRPGAEKVTTPKPAAKGRPADNSKR